MVCKSATIQEMIKRLLYIWHNRHPASGYVQGMCDVSMPFLIVFLGEYLPYFPQEVKFCPEPDTLTPETLESVEADMYWCMNKLMEYVTSNYTQGFDGLRQAYSRMEDLLGKIDSELLEHFRK
jgi:TBC1 domain family member 2